MAEKKRDIPTEKQFREEVHEIVDQKLTDLRDEKLRKAGKTNGGKTSTDNEAR